MSVCKHTKFVSMTMVGRMVSDGEEAAGDNVMPLSYMVHLKVKCADCDKPLLFRGEQGISLNGMRASLDQEEARLAADITPST